MPLWALQTTFSSSRARLPSMRFTWSIFEYFSDLMVLITHKIDKNKMATAINLIIQTFEGSTCLGVASRSLPSQQLLKQMFPEPYNLCNSTSLENLNITIR